MLVFELKDLLRPAAAFDGPSAGAESYVNNVAKEDLQRSCPTTTGYSTLTSLRSPAAEATCWQLAPFDLPPLFYYSNIRELKLTPTKYLSIMRSQAHILNGNHQLASRYKEYHTFSNCKKPCSWSKVKAQCPAIILVTVIFPCRHESVKVNECNSQFAPNQWPSRRMCLDRQRKAVIIGSLRQVGS